MEQRNRKFESQDVLIPWHKPPSRVGSVVGNRLHEPNNFASTTTGGLISESFSKVFQMSQKSAKSLSSTSSLYVDSAQVVHGA